MNQYPIDVITYFEKPNKVPDYSFKTFQQENIQEPTWLAYKKCLVGGRAAESNYIVGNFLLYFPIKYLEELEIHFTNQKRLLYSDRFFSKLYNKGFIKLHKGSVGTEIQHHSNIIQNKRVGKKIKIIKK